ncbi:MAG: ROK family transcriptional regulator [Clostridia bacterium]|nr:ROK family transcriptional regulator [Clostridia bacterium]
MSERITPDLIKQTNRQQIYNFIYDRKRVSQLEIAFSLRLSRPTVTANLTELETYGLIYKNGWQESNQTGRKPVGHSIVPDFRVAIGLELMRARAKIICVDLYGSPIRRQVLEIPYRNDPCYYATISESLMRFISDLKLSVQQVLGVGIAMQAVASQDGSSIVYGEILGCTGLTIDAFTRHLPFPCRFLHDPDAAAMCEIWCSPELNSAVYLSLSRHLGGSVISQRALMPGKHGHNATFEHIQAAEDGELCYCGRRGCWDTLCSMKALMGDEDPDHFFGKVRAGDKDALSRWNAYLDHLARLIGNLHLVTDVDFILGGHLAPYFRQDDISRMYAAIRTSCPFDETDDYILISKMPSHNITIGAALPYIKGFLSDIGQAIDGPKGDRDPEDGDPSQPDSKG